MERANRKGEYPYYGASGVIDYIDDYIFDGEFLLLAEDGENLNSRNLPIVFRASGKFWVNNHAHIIKAKAGVADDNYILYSLLGGDVSPFITGTAQPKLSQTNLKKIPIMAPGLPIQITVGNILSAYDDLIEVNNRRIKILEEMAQLIYREWFVHFRFPGHENVKMVASRLGKIPEGWEVTTVENAFRVTGGGTPSTRVSDYWEGGNVNWYSPSDLTSSKSMFSFRSSKKITEKGLKESSAKLFPAGCAMITSRATIGEVSINVAGASTNQGFITCIPNNRVSVYHLYFWLLDNVELFKQLASGSTFMEISKSTFKRIDFIIPSQDVREKFSSSIAPIANMIQALQLTVENLRETRDLLLPRLISGQIDVSKLDIKTA